MFSQGAEPSLHVKYAEEQGVFQRFARRFVGKFTRFFGGETG